jgi:hypothetical protein
MSKNFQYVDPDNLRMPDIKSRLHAMEIEFDVYQQKKNYYCEIYRRALEDPANREKIKDRLEKDLNTSPVKKRTGNSVDTAASQVTAPLKQPKVEHDSNSSLAQIIPDRGRQPLPHSFQNIIKNDLKQSNEIMKSQNELEKAKIITTSFNLITSSHIQPSHIKPEERKYASLNPPIRNEVKNIIPLIDSEKQNQDKLIKSDKKKQVDKTDKTDKNKIPKDIVEVEPFMQETNLMNFNFQVKRDNIGVEKKPDTKVPTPQINNDFAATNNFPTYNPVSGPGLERKTSGIITGKNITVSNLSSSNFSFGEEKSKVETEIKDYQIHQKMLFQKEFEKLKELAKNNPDFAIKQESPDVKLLENKEITTPKIIIPEGKVSPVLNISEKRSRPASNRVIPQVRSSDSIINGAEPRFVPSSENSNINVKTQPSSIPIINKFREEDKWNMPGNNGESGKPQYPLELLLKYLAAGFVCSAIFYGLYYCIMNFSFGFKFSSSNMSNFASVKPLVPEEIISTQNPEWLEFLKNFLTKLSYPIMHPRSFFTDVVLNGVKYLAVDCLWDYIKNNMWYIIGILVLSIIAYKIYREYQDRRTATRIYQNVKNVLKDIYQSNNPLEGLTEEEIIRDFSKENNITEENFKTNFMPRLRLIRQQDHEVKLFEKFLQGRARIAWEFIGHF